MIVDKEQNFIIQKISLKALLATGLIAAGLATATVAQADVKLSNIGTYKTGVFGESAAEILAYDEATRRLFVQNAATATIDIIDIGDPTQPALVAAVNPGGQPTNVDAHNGIVAVTIEGATRQVPGAVVFFDSDGQKLNEVTVGPRPDMLVFSPNGKWLLTANEGVPSDDYAIDPEGSVSIIDMRRGVDAISNANVRTAGLQAFNNARLDPSVRIFGANNPTVAQDLEPEHIAISPNSRTAWVSFQENNAIGTIDIKRGEFTDIVGLGFKDHSQPGNGLDASNRDGGINIRSWPVLGMYQPDAITAYRTRGKVYIVTANEGDARDYDGFSEETRMADLVLDPKAYPDAADLQLDENLGRLKTTTATGDIDGDGDVDQLYAFGARSFSIRTKRGKLVFDSGDDFEQITASRLPENFNSSDDENDSFDDRSDDKGPEPEYVVVGKVAGDSYAFIGLERIGGIMVYRITKPAKAVFVDYINTRDFSGDPEMGSAGDLSPEGLKFIKAKDSPTGQALLVVAFEVSGTVGIYEVRESGRRK